MHAYELRIHGLETQDGLNAARWELFACPEVRDLVSVGDGRDRFLVIYEGEWDQRAVWCRVLENAGYEAEPMGRIPEYPATTPPAATRDASR